MDLFKFQDYRDYLIQRGRSLPGGGRGELQRLAEAARVHPSVITVVLQGARELTLEQAQALAEYFEFTELEERYFLFLVQFARAGTQKLKRTFERQLRELREARSELVNRLPVSSKLSD